MIDYNNNDSQTVTDYNWYPSRKIAQRMIGTALIKDMKSGEELSLDLILRRKGYLVADLKGEKLGCVAYSVTVPSSQDKKYAIGYGKQIEQINRISVLTLMSFKSDRYKGVGRALMQALIEQNSHIELTASQNSHGFYKKLKMETLNPETDEKIEQELSQAEKEKRKAYTANLKLTYMYMGETGKHYWQEKIKSSPILFKTKELK